MFDGCPVQIPVEEGVCGGMPVVSDEIHHGECKVVEHVDRGNGRIELDRIKQNRLAIDQHNVRQMQVAMATPHVSLLAAPLQQLADPEICRLRSVVEVANITCRKTSCGSE